MFQVIEEHEQKQRGILELSKVQLKPRVRLARSGEEDYVRDYLGENMTFFSCI